METKLTRTFVAKVTALVVVLGAASCSDDHHGRAGGPTMAACPTTQTLTYADFGRPFMQSFCLRCHSTSVAGSARMGAPSDHNFDQVADIRSLTEHIDEYAGSGPAATNTIMPPADPRPSAEDRRKLSEWLACGAP